MINIYNNFQNVNQIENKLSKYPKAIVDNLKSSFRKITTVKEIEVIKFLRMVNRFNYIDGCTTSNIYSKYLQNSFGINYTDIIDTSIDNQYIKVGFDYNFIKNQHIGTCRSYEITSKGIDHLNNYSKKRIKQLTEDKKEIRKNKKRVSERKHLHRKYDSFAKQEIAFVNDNITWSNNKMDSLLDTFSKAKKAYTYDLLITIKEKNYNYLENNKSDNRISNPYTQLPEEVKRIIKISGKSHYKVLDIQGCHWSLFFVLLIVINYNI